MKPIKGTSKNRLVESIVANINETENRITEGVDWDYFNKFSDIDKKYLPSQGEGDNMATQTVTAITKLVYKWYNDGDVYDNSNPAGLTGWANDLSSYANWLAKYIDGAKDILDRIFNINYGDDGEYEEILKDLCDEYETEEFLERMAKQEKVGSIYDCDGPYSFDESRNYDDEEEW